MVANIKNSLREQGESVKEFLQKQTQKVEEQVKSENNNTKQGIERMKIDVRERNSSVKDDFREKIQMTEKIVKASEMNILGIVRTFKDDMHRKFDKVTGMTEYHDNKIGDLKQEVSDLRGDFMNSIVGISETVKAVADEVTRVGDKIENRLK